MTPDPAGSKRFYEAVVAGWTIEAQPSGAMDYRMITRSDGGNSGGVLRLTEEMQGHGARPCWLGYLGVSGVDAAVARVEEDGGRTLMPGHDIPGVGRIAMVTDPDGAPFYLMAPSAPAGRPDAYSDVFSVDRPQHVHWNELQASDQDRSVAFYTRHFGWRQEGTMDMGDFGYYRFLYQGETMICAIMPRTAQVSQAAWTFYIGVSDIDRAASIRSPPLIPKAPSSDWSARVSEETYRAQRQAHDLPVVRSWGSPQGRRVLCRNLSRQ